MVINKILFISTHLVSRRWLRTSCRGVLRTSRHLHHLPRLPSHLLTSAHFTSPHHPPTLRTHLTRPRLEHALGWPRACLEHASSRALLRACFEFSGGRSGWLDCRASSMLRARLGDVQPPGSPRSFVQEGPGGLNNSLVINKFLFITTHVCSRTKRLPRLEHALSLP